MSMNQVRWKMNSLTKKYKECIDNNSKSGRSLMTFQWFNEMDDIFGQQRNAVAGHTISSNFSHLESISSTSAKRQCYSKSPISSSKAKPSISSQKECHSKSASLLNASNSDISSENCSDGNPHITLQSSPMLEKTNNDSILKTKNSKQRPLHGTGSNLAKSKIALENQWLEYLKTKTERDKIGEDKHTATLEQKKEMIKLKRKHIALKEKEIEERNDYYRAKLKGKENRHIERMAIEKQKCRLLKNLLKIGDSDTE